VVTAEVIAHARQLQLDQKDNLRRNDAYRFFESAGGLFKTGPTQTNVCDLRVVVTSKNPI
jgi:glycerate 2-kinase